MPTLKSNSRMGAILRALRLAAFADDSGAAIVEFTIMAPMLVGLSVYTGDFGMLIYNKIEIQNAAQAGAQWAIANRGYNLTYIQQAGQFATKLASNAITITPSQFCACSVDASQNAKLTTWAGTCTPNTTCNTTGTVGSYVTVIAQLTNPYHSLFPYGIVQSTYTISATTTVRIQ
jgi:Flp pilus assembly protein TadG